MRKYYRSSKEIVLGGVAGGFSEYFNFDVTLIRVAFVVLAFLSFGIAVIAYIILWAVAPIKKKNKK